MKICARFLALLTAVVFLASACGSSDGDGDGTGTGGTSSTGGSSGSGGSSSGGASMTGGKGSGGSPASGGAATGGSASGGNASGGSGSGGTASGGSAPGGASATGGKPLGGSASGGAGGGAGNHAGGAPATGGRGGGAPAGGSGGGGRDGQGGSAGGSYNPCPTNGDPCRILPVGDSITVGINYEGAWRVEIFHRALMAGQKITFTGHDMNGPAMVDGKTFPNRFEAQSGITIAGISSKIDTDKALQMPADIVLIHIGTNDMYMTPAGAPDRLTSLIDKIAAALPNALIGVAKIIPLPMNKSAVDTYNAAIPGVVQKEVATGKHVFMVDLNTGFPSGDMDSVHPYQSGYNWMGDKWYEAISALLPK